MPIYEYECRDCGNKFQEYSSLPHDMIRLTCPKCGGTGERLYSLSVPRVFQSFTTRNILPDGEPITVRGSGQLRQLEANHGVKLADADATPPPTVFPTAS